MKQTIRMIICIAAIASGFGTIPCLLYLIYGHLADKAENKTP